MKPSDFRFDLPDELIAQQPAAERGGSRLLCLDPAQDAPVHRRFTDLPALLRRGDLLVFNDTRVVPARLFGCKAVSGGAVEILVERVLDARTARVQIRASKAPKPDTELCLFDDGGNVAMHVRVLRRERDFFVIEFPSGTTPFAAMEAIGHIPLPPYIERPDADADRARYQTVYAARDGAVAAPTAGLHFDHELLHQLREMGVESGFLTLHVGAGTFQPIRVDNVEEHEMHAEYAEVGAALCERIMRAHAEGRRVIAVGTTALRALESASDATAIHPFQAETRLFIYPGYRFRCVDALITNFHLSESTLLMLVCAFAGQERVLAAYREAVRERYRFFSYGDAMFVCGEQVPLLKGRPGA